MKKAWKRDKIIKTLMKREKKFPKNKSSNLRKKNSFSTNEFQWKIKIIKNIQINMNWTHQPIHNSIITNILKF